MPNPSRDIAKRNSDVAPRRRVPEVTLMDITMIFPNFAGKADTFNKEGDRNFSILLNEETAEQLINDGWNVKMLKPRDEDEAPRPYLQVAVSYKHRPPRIVLLTDPKGRTSLDEDLIHLLDKAETEVVDVTLNPYNWEVNGNRGVKAYLKVMYFKLKQDPLDIKYRDYEPAPLELEGGDDDIIDVEFFEEPVRELEG